MWEKDLKEIGVHAFGDGLESMVGWWSSCGCWHITLPNCVPRPTNTEKMTNYWILHEIFIGEKETVIHAVGDGLESMVGWIDDPPNCFPRSRNTATNKNCQMQQEILTRGRAEEKAWIQDTANTCHFEFVQATMNVFKQYLFNLHRKSFFEDIEEWFSMKIKLWPLAIVRPKTILRIFASIHRK